MYNLVHIAAIAIINKLCNNKTLANFCFNIYTKNYFYEQMYTYYYVLITY